MSEQIYDEKIAPLLAEVSKLCEQHDLPMFAVVEFEPGHFGETACQMPKQHMAVSMAHMASRSRGNLDALVISILRFCKKQGIATDASMVANRMTGQTPAGVAPTGEGQPCPSCNGKGSRQGFFLDHTKRTTCPHCGGTGKTPAGVKGLDDVR